MKVSFLMNKNSIFIFTKENSTCLKECIDGLMGVKHSYVIHIIDDSYSEISIEKNKDVVDKFNDIIYLGRSDYESFYVHKQGYNINGLKKFGTPDWNLGNCRNFALDYSIYMNYKKVLFIDHDIIIPNVTELEEGFNALNQCNFVSFKVTGMPDDSLIGHVCERLGVLDEDIRMLSGGFLFLCPSSIKSKFYNIYNEDWILQLIEDEKEKVTLPYSVTQKHFDPFMDYKNKVIFQEFGELVVTGLLKKDKSNLSQEIFWDQIIDERKGLLMLLALRALELNQFDLFNIVKFLKDNYSRYQSSDIITLLSS